VSTMPPDGKVPLGGLAIPGGGDNGLRIGDTVGRTPGAYSFIVSCSLEGYVGPDDTITTAQLQMRQSSLQGINPLSPRWTSDAGPGPIKISADLVKCWGSGDRHIHKLTHTHTH
jgi:hypothetical protein